MSVVVDPAFPFDVIGNRPSRIAEMTAILCEQNKRFIEDVVGNAVLLTVRTVIGDGMTYLANPHRLAFRRPG